MLLIVNRPLDLRTSDQNANSGQFPNDYQLIRDLGQSELRPCCVGQSDLEARRLAGRLLERKSFIAKAFYCTKATVINKNNRNSFTSSTSIKTAGLLWRSKQAENKKQDIKFAAECRLKFVISL